MSLQQVNWDFCRVWSEHVAKMSSGSKGPLADKNKPLGQTMKQVSCVRGF